MLIFVVDDEPIILKASQQVVQKAYPEADVRAFGLARHALQAIQEDKLFPDVIFCDIEMPGMTGLEFAVEIKTVSPKSKLIFVTGYSEYALEAFQVHAHGYILKPMTADRVLEECGRLITETPSPEPAQRKEDGRLQVRCFGYFEVFWKGKPLMFSRRQTKELFAYLVDRRGDACTAEEIAATLWEDEDNLKNLKARIRILISDLRQTLNEIGQEKVLIRRSGRVAVYTDLLDCDYIRMLSGDIDAINSFSGEYMLQYSWAEMTSGQLQFRS